jgi:hypothetical protein
MNMKQEPIHPRPAAAPPGDPPPDRSASAAREDAAAELDLATEAIAMLRQLARGAMTVAETIQHQITERAAQEKADGIERRDLTPAYARAARAVRLTLTLALKIEKGRHKRERAETAEREQQAEAERAERREQDREVVEEILHKALEHNESLYEAEREDVLDGCERLMDSPEFEAQLGEYPPEEIAGRVLEAMDQILPSDGMIKPEIPLASGLDAAVAEVRAYAARPSLLLPPELRAAWYGDDERDSPDDDVPAPDGSGADPP